jgi:hypothetical protein
MPRCSVLPRVARESPIDKPGAIFDGSVTVAGQNQPMPHSTKTAYKSPLEHLLEPHRTVRIGLRIRRLQVRVLPSALLKLLYLQEFLLQLLFKCGQLIGFDGSVLC